jgi:hypothetical protein
MEKKHKISEEVLMKNKSAQESLKKLREDRAASLEKKIKEKINIHYQKMENERLSIERHLEHRSND